MTQKKKDYTYPFSLSLLLLSNAGLETQDPRAWRHAWHGLTWILPWHQSNNINKESRHNFLVFTSHRLCQYQHVLLVLSEGGCVLYDDKSSIYFVVVWKYFHTKITNTNSKDNPFYFYQWKLFIDYYFFLGTLIEILTFTSSY